MIHIILTASALGTGWLYNMSFSTLNDILVSKPVSKPKMSHSWLWHFGFETKNVTFWWAHINIILHPKICDWLCYEMLAWSHMDRAMYLKNSTSLKKKNYWFWAAFTIRLEKQSGDTACYGQKGYHHIYIVMIIGIFWANISLL